MIRLAKIFEIPDILNFTEACAKSWIVHGIYHSSEYPFY